MKNGIFRDWKCNNNLKSRLVLVMFRLAYLVKNRKMILLFFFWYLPIYRVFVEWFLGIELSWNFRVGKNLTLYHGQSLIVNGESVMGDNCTLRHSTTIGNKKIAGDKFTSCPVIGNNVDIGAHVCILGDITIGNNVAIGAGSIVVKSVPDNCVVVGNPAKIIKQL